MPYVLPFSQLFSSSKAPVQIGDLIAVEISYTGCGHWTKLNCISTLSSCRKCRKRHFNKLHVHSSEFKARGFENEQVTLTHWLRLRGVSCELLLCEELKKDRIIVILPINGTMAISPAVIFFASLFPGSLLQNSTCFNYAEWHDT